MTGCTCICICIMHSIDIGLIVGIVFGSIGLKATKQVSIQNRPRYIISHHLEAYYQIKCQINVLFKVTIFSAK